MKTNASRITRLRFSPLALALLLSSGMPIVGQTYDVSHDFLSVTNPGTAWSYGWKSTLNGPFSLLPVHGAESDASGGVWEYWYRLPSVPSSVYRNSGTATLIANDGAGIYPPGTVWFGPGFDANTDNFCVIRFTVPAGQAGSCMLGVTVRPRLDGPEAGDTDFHILHNGTELFGENILPDTSASYTNTLVLSSGDTIDFIAGRGQDREEYGGGLKIAASLSINGPPLDIRFSQVELCWPTVPKVTYQLQYRDGLTNAWQPLGRPVAGDGKTHCRNDMIAPGQPRRFYRTVTVP